MTDLHHLMDRAHRGAALPAELDQLADGITALEQQLAEADEAVLQLAAHNDRMCEAVAVRNRAEATVTRVQDLRTTWLATGAPPLGTSIARWWDSRLIELNAALAEPKEPTS